MEYNGNAPAPPGQALGGATPFAWHQGGAFLIKRRQVDEPGFPNGVAIIGSDDTAGKFIMTYFDDRGRLSRKRAALGAKIRQIFRRN